MHVVLQLWLNELTIFDVGLVFFKPKYVESRRHIYIVPFPQKN
jgi:hypothetical protein